MPPLQLPRQPVPLSRWTWTESEVSSLVSPFRQDHLSLLTITFPTDQDYSPTAVKRTLEAQRQLMKQWNQPASQSLLLNILTLELGSGPFHMLGFSFAAVLKAKHSLH